MKISILTPDFSHNCFGRAWLLAKLLQKHYDIEVVGPAFGNGIWGPLGDLCDFDVRMVRGYDRGRFELRGLLNMISGDVIYASKPLMASFGVGLAKKIRTRKALVLDIDDWEVGLQKDYYNSLNWHDKLYYMSRCILCLKSYYYNIMLDKLIRLADAKTVSGNVMHTKYGGTVVWHGRDTDLFNPQKFDKSYLRKIYFPSLTENSFIVSFIGSPRPQKGLEDLIAAVHVMQNLNIFLMIVGDDDGPYCKALMVKLNDLDIAGRTLFLPEQPFHRIPELLAMSDVVVIPQRQRAASYAQVPAKLFDAMAMGKPIISTNVSDIPEILTGCGWIVDSENPIQIAKAIQYIYEHPEEAEVKGNIARQKCKNEYSWKVMEQKLVLLFERYRLCLSQ